MSDEQALQNNQARNGDQPAAGQPEGSAPDVAEFSEGMGRKPASGSTLPDEQKLSFLSDVNLEMSVELGRTRMNIGEIMELTQGSVIELDKMAGEPVDIRVNGVLLASGEVIVIDDVFGVRVTRLHNRVDRQQYYE